MTKRKSEKALYYFGFFEAASIIATGFFGVMEAWGAFAAFALLSVLTPLWIMAAALATMASIMMKEGKQ